MQANHQKTLELYASVMNEVRIRLRLIDSLHRGEFQNTIPATLAREMCFLQFRMVFEVIAIAILAIHRDAHNIRNLDKQWSANQIMPAIETLNPNYFPHAVTTNNANITDITAINDIEPHPMTKATFLESYGRCGNELHRGTLRKLSSHNPQKLVPFDDILELNSQIWRWLRIHRISSHDLMQHYLGFLEYRPAGGIGAIFIMQTNFITYPQSPP